MAFLSEGTKWRYFEEGLGGEKRLLGTLKSSKTMLLISSLPWSHLHRPAWNWIHTEVLISADDWAQSVGDGWGWGIFSGSQESNLIEFRTQFSLQVHRIGHPCILCPISHYERVLFPFVNNLSIFSSLLVYISPLKVLCILFCWLFIYLFIFGSLHD